MKALKRMAYAIIFVAILSNGNLVNAQALDKGYYESGLVIHNILRMNTFNIGYFGVGVGAFYRYGPYQYPIERANWAFKLAMMYSIN